MSTGEKFSNDSFRNNPAFSPLETATVTYYATGTADYTDIGITDDMNGLMGNGTGGPQDAPNHLKWLLIFLYIVIFILAVVGNILVIMTLVHNKRMRTVTNVFLFSLAVSDVMFAIVCIPFTLVGNILQRFIFGAGICKIVPYFQGELCGDWVKNKIISQDKTHGSESVLLQSRIKVSPFFNIRSRYNILYHPYEIYTSEISCIRHLSRFEVLLPDVQINLFKIN